jgi:hypothetical protein
MFLGFPHPQIQHYLGEGLEKLEPFCFGDRSLQSTLCELEVAVDRWAVIF